MFVMRRIHTTRNQQQAVIPMLLGLTAVVLTLQSPMHTDAPGLSFPQLEFPTPSQILEMRPNTPPPGVSGDQLTLDEPDQVSVTSSNHRDQSAGDDPRARPQR